MNGHHRQFTAVTTTNIKQIMGLIVKKILKIFYFNSDLGYGGKKSDLVINQSHPRTIKSLSITIAHCNRTLRTRPKGSG